MQRVWVACCLLALGCDVESDVGCTREAFSSAMIITVADWQSSYGDVDHAELRACLPSGCSIASISSIEGGFECRPNASLGSPHQQCVLDPSGALVITLELQGSPADLHGDHLLSLELTGASVDAIVGEASIRLKPTEGNGEGCGITHVFGQVSVDATLSPTTG